MATKTIEKTIKFKLIPLTRSDKGQLVSLLNDYTSMVKDALDVIIKNDVRSRKRAHELCYRILREKYPHLHNKFVQEAYKRALAVYRSYRKLLNKWKRLPKKKRKRISPPSLPTIEGNRVVELHVDTCRLEKRHNFLVLIVSKGNGTYLRFLVMVYNYARKEIEGGS